MGGSANMSGPAGREMLAEAMAQPGWVGAGPAGITYREMAQDGSDAEGKGFVHWKSWQESYQGMVDRRYLADLTVDKCVEIARKWPENTIVALEQQIVGFVCWCPCRDEDEPEGTGEISAIYLLKAFQGRGIGKMLIEMGLAKLKDCPTIIVWVLAENQKAIGFYEHCGLAADGGERYLDLGTKVRCIRMRKKD